MSAATSLVMRALQAGIPLTLLIDLRTPGGPDSAEIARHERLLAAQTTRGLRVFTAKDARLRR